MTKNQTKVLSLVILSTISGMFMLYKTIFIKTISVKCSQRFAENDLFKKKIKYHLFYVKVECTDRY